MKVVVLDASALTIFFMGDHRAPKVREMIVRAGSGEVQLLMSVVNFGEVYYTIWHYRGERIAGRFLEQSARLPIAIEEANLEETMLAAEFKARHSLPYADCFAASLAHHRDGLILTSDSDFLKVKKHVPVQML